MDIIWLVRQFTKVPRAAIRRLGFDITRYPPRPLIHERQELEIRIASLTQNTVTSGLFTGLILPCEEWRANKLLGLYEKELEPVLEDVVRSKPDVVINVGCGAGFYALGLARLLPNAKVIAYDINQRARELCASGRQLNNLDGAFEVRGHCSPEELKNLTQISRCPFAIIDCEGGERELLLQNNYDYANTSMIIECHDVLDRSITSDLVNKFSKTHAIELIKQGEKNPFACEITKGWSENDLWAIVSEGRPERMHWLNLKPLARSSFR